MENPGKPLPPPPGEVTKLLVAWSEGDAAALQRLAPLVESELHKLALHYISREHSGHILQATALVNEAYLRLIGTKVTGFPSRAYFFGLASTMMRRILVDHARHSDRLKRGRGAVMVSLSEAEDAASEPKIDVIALDQALTKLASFDSRKSQIVELRFFGGLSEDETAEVLKVPLRTVQREWSLARAWLFCELNGTERKP